MAISFASACNVNAGRCLPLLALWFLASAAHAAEIRELDVQHEDGRYTVRFDVLLAAPIERLKYFLTDYDRYTDHFASIKESRVLSRTPPGTVRVRFKLRSCILFFCRSVIQVKDISEKPDGAIEARIDPAASDFRDAVEHWRLTDERGQTRLQYRAELTPTFYVPPLIGPWLIKRQIRAALNAGGETLEALAREKSNPSPTGRGGGVRDVPDAR